MSIKYPVRCVIIEFDTDVYKTPEKSKPYIGEHGLARLLDNGLPVEITLDAVARTTGGAGMNKSDRFRKLLEKEKYLQNQLNDCETAQSRMLKKAFKNLGLKLGYYGEMLVGQPNVAISEITDCSVKYYYRPGIRIETYEITFEDLFDA